MSLHNRATHTVEVQSPQDAQDALDAADTLDLELRHAEVHDTWEYTEDVAINSHAPCEIAKIGRKWFYLNVDGEEIKCKPRRARTEALDDGTLRLIFD